MWSLPMGEALLLVKLDDEKNCLNLDEDLFFKFIFVQSAKWPLGCGVRKKKSQSMLWFKITDFLFLNWHKIAALMVVTCGGEQVVGLQEEPPEPSASILCCSLRPGILKLMKINVKLSYGCSLVAEPVADWGENVCQHWDVCSWLHALWDRAWCLTPNPLLVGSKHLPTGTYSIC